MSEMGLQIWFREDIENNLLAVYETMQATTTALENNDQSGAYCQGFEDALKCVAASFGIKLVPKGIVSLPQRKHLTSADS